MRKPNSPIAWGSHNFSQSYSRSLLFLLGILFLPFSCAKPPAIEPLLLDPAHFRPPELKALQMAPENSIELRFDKPTWIEKPTLRVEPALPVLRIQDGDVTCRVYLAKRGEAGRRYTVEARVRDDRGNTSEFVYGFYGFNERIPKVLINEFITTSSTTVLTQVELTVLRDGNMGGITFYEGTKEVPDKMFIFPSFEVKEGDYILLHFKPEGTEGEIDETTDKTLATGKGASPTAFDFWAKGTSSLSQDNDVLSLYTNPEGEFLDAVLYSTKVFEEGMRYNGFGTSSMLQKVQTLQAASAWTFAGSEPYPSDAVNPKGATSRRSICRDSRSTDTNSKEDWHIVPTGKASFGEVNSDALYTP
ncbi:MAG: hypothetical protein SNJ78_06510 [Spirochaetales bacterium]